MQAAAGLNLDDIIIPPRTIAKKKCSVSKCSTILRAGNINKGLCDVHQREKNMKEFSRQSRF